MKELIRVGVVSKVNWSDGTVDVVYPDSDDMVSTDIPVLGDYDLPSIDDSVLVTYLSADSTRGFVVGRPLFNIPSKASENGIVKIFGQDSIVYDKLTRTLTIDIPNLVIKGNIEITGDITVHGTLSEVKS